MSQSYIAATRQELLKLKDKYKSAKRGHKLLKDKRDSLIQIFMKTYKEAALMRAFFDKEYINSRERFKLATSNINDIYLKAVAKTTESRILIDSKVKSIMGVRVQDLTGQTIGGTINYSQLETNYHLDEAVNKISNVVPQLIELIEKEYRVRKLADEIEKTRKRVSALEYVILPEMMQKIKLIKSKLEELALQNTVRLMKIKKQITKNA